MVDELKRLADEALPVAGFSVLALLAGWLRMELHEIRYYGIEEKLAAVRLWLRMRREDKLERKNKPQPVNSNKNNIGNIENK